MRVRGERRIKESRTSIVRAAYEGEAIRNALDLLDVQGLITSTDVVVITPNWVKNAPVESGTVVGPESLKELIRWVKQFSPKRIVVACGSGGAQTTDVMESVGYSKVIGEEKVEFVDLNYGPYTEISLEMAPPLDRIKVNRLYEETTVLISFGQIKIHEEATVSLGIKNVCLSWPPAEIHGFPKKNTGIHDNLHEFIAAMAKRFPIDLTVLSSDKGMVGTGPSGGLPVDADIVIASTDPVTADVIGARLLGFLPQAVRYLHTLIRDGVGEGDLNKVDLRGMSIEDAEVAFSRAAYGMAMAIDKGGIRR